jgi:hypothetical protein
VAGSSKFDKKDKFIVAAISEKEVDDESIEA